LVWVLKKRVELSRTRTCDIEDPIVRAHAFWGAEEIVEDIHCKIYKLVGQLSARRYLETMWQPCQINILHPPIGYVREFPFTNKTTK